MSKQTAGRPIAWPDPKTEISKRLQDVLPKLGRDKIAGMFFNNLSGMGVKSILSGDTEPPPSSLLKIAKECDCNLDWLAWGKGEQRPMVDIPAPSRRLPMMKMREYPTRGLAADDDSGRTAGPDTDEIGYPVRLPESMAFTPIVGESMSPVLLGGQLAIIDMNREGFERDRGIVIVNILEDRSNPGMPEPITGTFCKRCERGDGVLYFTSINNYPPFSAWEENCRIWPVIGVWFGDKGVTSVED